MKQFILFSVIIITLGLYSCENPNAFKIEGTLNNSEKLTLKLDKLAGQTLEAIDSFSVDANGNFQFEGVLQESTFMLLRIPSQNQKGFITLLVNPSDKINLTIDLTKQPIGYTINGSVESQQIKELELKISQSRRQLDSIARLNNPEVENYKELKAKLDNDSRIIIKEQKEFNRKFIEENKNSLVSIIALTQMFNERMTVLNFTEDFRYYQMVDESLMEHHAQSPYAQNFHLYFEQAQDQLKQQEYASKMIGIGSEAPEIELPTPAGKTVSLSSLRGQYVLLDFWASWCMPCRAENPTLVRAYAKYNKMGFEIYQVSLDKTKNEWEAAIKDDNLTWTHVSDLKFWNSTAAQLYQVKGIPTNFLLDPKGVIIAKNLRGPALGQKLKEIFEK